MTPSITIAGLGLIGGSLGMALRQHGWRVSYVDPRVEMDEAHRAGAADARLESIDGDLVVLAAPVDRCIEILHSLDPSPSLTTSVCSVMRPLREAAGALRFVAGHPLAGSEQSGLSAARTDLFAGRPWFVERLEPRLERLILDAGAKPVEIDASRHDEIVALTSHLPQLLATALAALIERETIDPQFFGRGLRSMLRLAGSSHEVWNPVLESNADNIRRWSDALRSTMESASASDFEAAHALYEKLKKE